MLRLILSCLVLSLAVVGCGGSDTPTTRADASTETAPATTPTTATTPKNTLPKPKSPGPHPDKKVDHLIVKDLVKGTGPEIASGDTGTFDFIGTNYATGAALESTWKNGKPWETVVEHNVVIDGWWQGIPGMRVGGRRLLIIPPELGFVGNTNPKVKDATTYFIVDLLAVTPAEPTGVPREESGEGTPSLIQ
jgi:peptidylprolyl isomerase